MNHPMHRRVAIQSVDLNTGTVETFTESEPIDKYGEMMAASASIAFTFQPTTSFDGLELADGGTFSNINL